MKNYRGKPAARNLRKRPQKAPNPNKTSSPKAMAGSKSSESVRGQQSPVPSRLLTLPIGILSPDPVEENPFSKTNPRHQVWSEATLKAEQELCRLHSDLLQKQGDGYERHLTFMFAIAIGTFDVWANRGVNVVWSEYDSKGYEKWLIGYAEAWLNQIDQTWGKELPGGVIIVEAKSALLGRVQYWRAEARRYLAEQKTEEKHSDGSGGLLTKDPTGNQGQSFVHSDDYRSVRLRKQEFTLTHNQSGIIRVLYEQWEKGSSGVGKAFVLEQAGVTSDRWPDVWRSNPKARRALIKIPRKGMIALNL
jgi:hypothetical protein